MFLCTQVQDVEAIIPRRRHVLSSADGCTLVWQRIVWRCFRKKGTKSISIHFKTSPIWYHIPKGHKSYSLQLNTGTKVLSFCPERPSFLGGKWESLASPNHVRKTKNKQTARSLSKWQQSQATGVVVTQPWPQAKRTYVGRNLTYSRIGGLLPPTTPGLYNPQCYTGSNRKSGPKFLQPTERHF